MEPGEATAGRRVRVVVVDDQLLLREGIATLLESDPRIQVVGRGSTGQDAIDLAGKLRPHVILLDIRMPGMDGIQAIREIKAHLPEVRTIILSSFFHDGYVVEGLMAGTDGYLLEEFVSGGSYLRHHRRQRRPAGVRAEHRPVCRRDARQAASGAEPCV